MSEVTKFVTLVITYDDEETAHPTTWDWDALIGETVERVEVYGV